MKKVKPDFNKFFLTATGVLMMMSWSINANAQKSFGETHPNPAFRNFHRWANSLNVKSDTLDLTDAPEIKDNKTRAAKKQEKTTDTPKVTAEYKSPVDTYSWGKTRDMLNGVGFEDGPMDHLRFFNGDYSKEAFTELSEYLAQDTATLSELQKEYEKIVAKKAKKDEKIAARQKKNSQSDDQKYYSNAIEAKLSLKDISKILEQSNEILAKKFNDACAGKGQFAENEIAKKK